MQQYMKELEQVTKVFSVVNTVSFHNLKTPVFSLLQRPFDPETFVERLAWRILENTKEKGSYNFNADIMKDTFNQSVKLVSAQIFISCTRISPFVYLVILFRRDLMFLQQRQKKKCDQIRNSCKTQEKEFWEDVAKQLQYNKVNEFQPNDTKNCMKNRDDI